MITVGSGSHGGEIPTVTTVIRKEESEGLEVVLNLVNSLIYLIIGDRHVMVQVIGDQCTPKTCQPYTDNV